MPAERESTDWSHGKERSDASREPVPSTEEAWHFADSLLSDSPFAYSSELLPFSSFLQPLWDRGLGPVRADQRIVVDDVAYFEVQPVWRKRV